MRVKLLTTIFFFTCQLSICQTEKLIHGKVLAQNSILKGVEVINKTAKPVQLQMNWENFRFL